MGARSDHWPCQAKPVTPYVAELFPSGFANPSCDVKVLAVERTFWEKATILHAEYHRPSEKEMPDRLSRHYYDFFSLLRNGVDEIATSDLQLLARVAEHKTFFFRSGWAKYGEATKGSLRLSPPEARLRTLREDYRKMQEMFFKKPPPFDEIVEEIMRWETRFNAE